MNWNVEYQLWFIAMWSIERFNITFTYFVYNLTIIHSKYIARQSDSIL